MKRPVEEDERPNALAPTVRLNVGGVPFDTTRNTLAKCRYFEPVLERRLRHAVDDQGRVFIDRDGTLFAYLLNYMRTHRRPAHKIVHELRDQLLEECAYFGFDAFAKNLRGEVSAYDMRWHERSVREKEAMLRNDPMSCRQGFLIDPFKVDTARRPRHDLELPLLLASGEAPGIKDGYAAFRERLDAFSGGLLDSLKLIPGVILAGGAVIGALTDTDKGDLDIFLTLPAPEAEQALRKVFAVVQANQATFARSEQSRLLITRSNAAFTIYRICGGKVELELPPVQVILNTFTCVADILVGFDVDVCGFAWVAAEERVACTPRALAALRYGVNIADSQFDGLGYCRRLEKYAGRGWAVAVPGFDAARLRPELLRGNYVFLKSHDLLLRVQPRAVGRQGLSIDTLQANGRGQLFNRTSHITASAVQSGTSVRGFERLIVLDGGIAQNAFVPSVRFCEKHSRIDALPARTTGACVPLVCENGHYALLWGADVGNSDSEDDDDTSGMSETPRASVYGLLEKHFAMGLQSCTDETPRDCDAMYPGGAMQKCKSSLRGSKMSGISHLRATLISRLATSKKLLYVYDFCTCHTEFDNLRFVLDAARPPLKADLKSFKSVYGLPATMEFSRRVRAPYSCDWWASVY
jgi:hypothetical protein